jgi:hypothetical protein
MPDHKVRVSRPILSHLEGSHAWQVPHADGGYNSPANLVLMAKLKAAKTRKDGSVVVVLDDQDRRELLAYTQAQEVGAADTVGECRMGDEDYAGAVGELNAVRALITKLYGLQ